MKYVYMITFGLFLIIFADIYDQEQFRKKCLDAGGVSSVEHICFHPSSIIEVE